MQDHGCYNYSRKESRKSYILLLLLLTVCSISLIIAQTLWVRARMANPSMDNKSNQSISKHKN